MSLFIDLCCLSLSVRVFLPAPISSSLNCQLGEQWTHLFCRTAYSWHKLQPLTDLHALSKKCMFYFLYFQSLHIFFMHQSEDREWVYFVLLLLDCMFLSLPLPFRFLWLAVHQRRERRWETVSWSSGLAQLLCSRAQYQWTAQGLAALQLSLIHLGTPGYELLLRAPEPTVLLPSALSQTTQVNSEICTLKYVHTLHLCLKSLFTHYNI